MYREAQDCYQGLPCVALTLSLLTFTVTYFMSPYVYIRICSYVQEVGNFDESVGTSLGVGILPTVYKIVP
jgi:hypothetical protein